MADKPLISVICITYNHANYIRQAIDSIVSQELDNDWEIIISDDHSTDKTPSILKEFGERFPCRIKLYFNDENIGIIPNFVKAFKACRGKYISFLEGDDYWTDRRKLQKQLDFLENNTRYSGISGGVQLYYEAKKEFKMPYDLRNPYLEKDITLAEYLNGNAAYLQTLLFKRELINPNELIYSFGDIHIQTELLQNGPIRQLPFIFTVYRKHNTGVTNSLFVKNKRQLFADLIHLFEKLNKKTSYAYNKMISDRLFDYYVCFEFSQEKISFTKKMFSIFKFLINSRFLKRPSFSKLKTLYHAAFKNSYAWSI